MMQGDQAALNVHSGSAFGSASEKYTDFTRIHLVEQLLLLFSGVIVMDKGNFFLRYALGNQLVLNIVIYIEALGRHLLYFRHFQIFKPCVVRNKRPVRIYCRFGYN